MTFYTYYTQILTYPRPVGLLKICFKCTVLDFNILPIDYCMFIAHILSARFFAETCLIQIKCNGFSSRVLECAIHVMSCAVDLPFSTVDVKSIALESCSSLYIYIYSLP